MNEYKNKESDFGRGFDSCKNHVIEKNNWKEGRKEGREGGREGGRKDRGKE